MNQPAEIKVQLADSGSSQGQTLSSSQPQSNMFKNNLFGPQSQTKAGPIVNIFGSGTSKSSNNVIPAALRSLIPPSLSNKGDQPSIFSIGAQTSLNINQTTSMEDKSNTDHISESNQPKNLFGSSFNRVDIAKNTDDTSKPSFNFGGNSALFSNGIGNTLYPILLLTRLIQVVY